MIEITCTCFVLKVCTVEHIGGDGTGEIRVDSSITMDVAQDHQQTHAQSSLYIYGVVSFPATTYAEQTVTNEGIMVGVEHWYSRGHTLLMSTGQSKCSLGTSHVGKYYLTSFTALSDGTFTIEDTGYDSNASVSVFTDVFHMEGQSHGYIVKAGNLMGRIFEIEKQSVLDGVAEGYSTNSGTGAGCSSSCGSGGGHGGSGGNCYGCGSCSGGGTYDSSVLPSLAGSGGGVCSHGAGGAGGSALRLVHTFTVVDGQITMSGEASTGGGGGGAGGSIWLDGDIISGRGYLNAYGGSAGSDGGCNNPCCNGHRGGGGGGGRIRSYGKEYTSKVLEHRRSVAGGSGSYRSGNTGSLQESHGNACSGHGVWNTSSLTCECFKSFVGLDCQYYCDDDITCDGNGVCNDQGQCECNTGYVGTHCESQCHRDVDCNDHGECSTCGACVCDPCFSGPDCSIECGGFGSCVADQCVCDDCHLGVFCESECNSHGSCDPVNNTCNCDANWGEEKCTKKGCPGSDLNCNGHGICNSGTSECFCNIGWKGKIFQ